MKPRTEAEFIAYCAARVADYDAQQAAFRDDAGLARGLSKASTDRARGMIDWLGTLDRAGPLARAELCKLVERGDDPLTQDIFQGLRLEDPTTELHALACRALA